MPQAYQKSVAVSLFVALLLLVSACSASPPPTPAPASTLFTADIDVGGYELHVSCEGTGSPAVVLEHGFGYSSSEWTATKSALVAQTRVCSYDRSGSGGLSGLSPKTRRTSMDMVDDLRTLLGKIDLKPPYILVGQDVAAFNAQIYATRFPAEVAGVVMVDGLHPDEIINCRSWLAPRSDSEPTAVTSFRLFCNGPQSGSAIFEGGADLMASARQAKASGKIGGIPLVVLSRNPNSRGKELWGYPAGLPDEIAAKDQQVHAEGQKDLLTLSTRATLIVAAKSSMRIPQEDPAEVVAAIRLALNQARGK